MLELLNAIPLWLLGAYVQTSVTTHRILMYEYAAVPIAFLMYYIPHSLVGLKHMYSIVWGAFYCYQLYGYSALTNLVGGTAAVYVILSVSKSHRLAITAATVHLIAGYAHVHFYPSLAAAMAVIPRMYLLLKMVSLSLRYRDSGNLPPIFNVYGWVFFVPSLWQGPVIEYKDYADMCTHDLWPNKTVPNRTVPMIKGIINVFVWKMVVDYYAINHFNIHQTARNLHKYSMGYKMYVAWAHGSSYRWLTFYDWSLLELAAIASGIAYNGVDDKGNAKWNRTQVFDPLYDFTCIFGWGGWNSGVSRWFKYNFYLELAPKGSRPHLGFVMLTSLTIAFWHGANAGILFFLLGFCMKTWHRVVERMYASAREKGWKKWQMLLLYAFAWVSLYYQINFAVVSFMCHSFSCAFTFWKEIYFMPIFFVCEGVICSIYLYTHPEKPVSDYGKKEVVDVVDSLQTTRATDNGNQKSQRRRNVR